MGSQMFADSKLRQNQIQLLQKSESSSQMSMKKQFPDTVFAISMIPRDTVFDQEITPHHLSPAGTAPTTSRIFRANLCWGCLIGSLLHRQHPAVVFFLQWSIKDPPWYVMVHFLAFVSKEALQKNATYCRIGSSSIYIMHILHLKYIIYVYIYIYNHI